MNHAISIELQFFFISILWGAIILLAYDILRIVRRIIKHNSFILAIEDIIFWVVTSLFIFAMIYTENNGIIRGFSVIGVTIGMVLYHYILSDLIVKSITKLIQILLTPFNMAKNMVKRFFRFVFLKGKKALNFVTMRLKKHLKSYKMKVDAKRQVLEEKKKQKLAQRALERKKKEELNLAKRKAKEDQREKEGKGRKSEAKKKNTKHSSSKAASDSIQLIPVNKNAAGVLRSDSRRVVELVLDTTTGNRVSQNRRLSENNIKPNANTEREERAQANSKPLQGNKGKNKKSAW